jgi:aminoglycoside phosphotransferase (APT) family kinase protein
VWPTVEVVDPLGDEAPWAEAASLLARLHRMSLAGLENAPEADPLARLRRAFDRLPAVADAAPVRAAGLAVLASPTALGSSRRKTLIHGDWHLGQLGRHHNTWLLIDIDDMGVGDPAWDLARPAAWWATGLLGVDQWLRFLDSYRRADGPALPPGGDPGKCWTCPLGRRW